MVNIAPLTAASKTGVPAFEKFLDASVPWLTRLKPYLGNFVPIFNYINTYRREIAAFFANGTATTQATAQNITQTQAAALPADLEPGQPGDADRYQHRLDSNRGNPYMAPGGYEQLMTGYPYSVVICAPANPQPTIGPTIPAKLAAILQDVYYTATPGGPPCKAQAPLGQRDDRVSFKRSHISNPCHEHGRRCSQNKPVASHKEDIFETESHHRHGVVRAGRRRSGDAAAGSTRTPPRIDVLEGRRHARASRSGSASRRRSGGERRLDQGRAPC